MRKFCCFLLLCLAIAQAQQTPTPAAAEWWGLTTDLSNDGMEGRDTGTEAYERAARYVAEHFASYGLKPAGDNGTWFQRVRMHQVSLVQDQSSVILHQAGENIVLHFTTEVTTTPRGNFSLRTASLLFLGYGIPQDDADLRGKIVVFFNNLPADLPAQEREGFAARRAQFFKKSGAAALLSIDNPAGIEPFHWPAAYARSVTLLSATPPTQTAAPTIRLNPARLAALVGEDKAATILADGGKGTPLASFLIKGKASIVLKVEEKDISSPNVFAILPGSDSTLAAEYVALSAHLDGYGYGTPVLGDNLYHGTLDDAAYVATLLQMAHRLSAPGAPQAKRSLLFCIFTGEEKGLLGSEYFTAHPTVPTHTIVADLNLDQLRPIFSLNILTMEGITDSTLGEIARSIATGFHIELRPDREPERNLFRRADNYNFVRVGVPIASFIFGYNPGTGQESIYRDWYARRYHKPQDDLSTPIVWDAAVKFNDFYQALALSIANDAKRPAWLPGSGYAPTTKPAQ